VENERGLTGSSGFGVLLRRYRLAAGLSQEALADRARMSSAAISSLERGQRRTPQRETLKLLVGALALEDEQREALEMAATRPQSVRRGPGTGVTLGPWADMATSNLPLALKSFVGRAKELNEIIALVRDHRLVTLVGVGGLGKTETALHVGRALNDSTGTAVCFVKLAPIRDSSLVATAIASALGVQEVPNRPLLETLVAYLNNKTLLLILDNCEHVIMQAAIIAESILSTCPRATLLTTSRESLRAAGEQTYRLPSLSVPSPDAASRIRAADAEAYGAIALFSDRARAVDHRFAVTSENAPTVAELCRRLDGIPLAIELAAARVNQLSPKMLANRIGDRFRILTGGERTALARQQTMRATIDWSYDLLSAPEQRVFERLSVFAGGCALDAATTVSSDEGVGEGDVFDLLSSLVDKSLAVADLEGNEPRYRLLESFRQYAHEKLTVRGEQELVTRRLALACLDLAKPLDRIFSYEPDEVLVAQVLQELDNWRAALQWTLAERNDAGLGQRLVAELCVLWQAFAPAEGRRWVTSALELVDERTPTSLIARLSYTEATVAMALGQWEVARASSKVAVARYRVVGDSLGIALAEAREAHAALELGRVAEAKPLLEEALPLAQSAGNRWLEAWILRLFGGASLDDGDVVASRGYRAEALQIYEELGSERDIAFTLMDLCRVEFSVGNGELALRHITEAQARFRAINHARGVAESLTLMAHKFLLLARYDEAQTSTREALALARECHLDFLAGEALETLAAIAALRSHDRARVAACKRAAMILGFVNARLRATNSLRTSEDQEQYDRTHATLQDALGAGAVANLMAEGAAMTEDQAVAEASSAE
jgi:predicted ATPase/transcriptional regulator with XRE-family HTH domain